MSFENDFEKTAVYEHLTKLQLDELQQCIDKNYISKQEVREAIEKITKKHAEHNEAMNVIWACFCADIKKELEL